MKLWGTTGWMAVAMAGLGLGISATAEEMPASRFQAASRKSAQVGPVDYRDYYSATAAEGDPSPSDAAKTTEGAIEGPSSDCACGDGGCGDCGSDCGCGDESNPCGDPVRLMDRLTPCLGECTQWSYGGWWAAGITGNGHNQRGQNANIPVAFNTMDNGPMANQLWGWVERASDTGGCGWDWGFRVDYLFGSDARFTQATGDVGYDNDWDTNAIYGSALPQLYAMVSYNDVNVKVGHFFTIIGHEVVQAPQNFFYSHPYTMVWGEPFTHTGLLADWKYSDQVTLYGGYVQGWDSGFNNSNQANLFLGGIGWNSCSGNDSLAYMLNAGDFGNGNVGNQGDIYMHSIVYKHKFQGDVQYILQSDFAANGNSAQGDTAWYGVNQYLIKDINCCWAVGARFEWFRDQDGVRVPSIDGAGNVAGNAGDYWAATVGVNWKPHTNVIVRPELRYDWHTGGGTPYANATQAEQFTFGVDGIFIF